jgi:hypothetical protein
MDRDLRAGIRQLDVYTRLMGKVHEAAPLYVSLATRLTTVVTRTIVHQHRTMPHERHHTERYDTEHTTTVWNFYQSLLDMILTKLMLMHS